MSPDGFDHRNVLATSQFSGGVREKWVSWFATKKYLIFLELARKIILLSDKISSYGYKSSPPPYCPRKSHWCVRQNSFGVPNRPMSEITETQQKNGGVPGSVPNAARWPQYVSQGPRGTYRRWMGSKVCSWVACPRKLGHVREKSQSHRIPYLFRYNTTQTLSGDHKCIF